MDTETNRIEELVDHLREYADIKIAKAKLSIASKTSKVISFLFAGMAIGLILLFSLVFLGFSLAHQAGAWFGNLPLGFLAVGVLYLLIGLLVWKSRERLFRIPIMNQIITQIFDDEEEDK